MLCDTLDGHEADVMAMAGVLGARVSQSDEELHGRGPKEKD
jgi:hypothetical protein